MPFTLKATAISPKPFNVGRVKREIQYVLEQEGIDDRNTLKKTTEGWSSAPMMDYEYKVKGNEAYVWIGPAGSQDMIDKWRRLDEGTEEHPITPVNVPYLVFPYQGKGRSYIAKTKPRYFGQAGSGQKLGPITKRKHVLHPGNEPREWSKVLAERRIKPFAASVQAAINRGLAP